MSSSSSGGSTQNRSFSTWPQDKKLKFADDVDLLDEDMDDLQENLKRIDEAGETAGCRSIMNYMVFGQENVIEKLMIGSMRIENVSEFVHTSVAYTHVV